MNTCKRRVIKFNLLRNTHLTIITQKGWERQRVKNNLILESEEQHALLLVDFHCTQEREALVNNMLTHVNYIQPLEVTDIYGEDLEDC